MSRDHRDKRGGHRNKTMVASSPTKFYQYCRRVARHKAKQALRQGGGGENRSPNTQSKKNTETKEQP